MRILQVVSDTDRRGAQVFATDLEAALRARGHDVQTVALARGLAGGTPIEPLAGRWPSVAALRALRVGMALAEVTIAHGSSTGPACALAGLGPGRPFVYRQIGDSRYWAPTPARRRRVRATVGRARVVVALSEFNRAQLVDWIGLRASRIVVVPNGAPAARFAPATAHRRRAARDALGLPDAPTMLFVGALVPLKRVDLAIRTVRRIPDAHLVVAGAGPERERLEELAGEEAPGRVSFVGVADDTVPLYHAADLLVLPSEGGEAMPGVLVEAGLCGLAVVSTRVGAIPEVVLDGRTGHLVAPGDEHGFAGAVERLVADPGTRAAMGDAARAHCLEHYEIGRVAARWEAVLTEVLGRA